MNQVIYKIVSRDEWSRAEEAGEFHGSELDLADGFIHFSAADQTVETAAKYFAGRENLLLLCVDTERLGDKLRWETSRGGALFPHLYDVLPVNAVSEIHPLTIGPDGSHQFPSSF